MTSSPRVGYHCSHEQHPPDQLLADAIAAERAGFATAMCSDHFAPWSEQQGQSGHAWAWLGSALQATGMTFGTVTAPGQRYHPAVLAQAIATLGIMFPGRLWVALGTGEALNEHITGDAWPARDERRARLGECVQIMRALLAGEQVSHRGRVQVHEARLYSRPERSPALYGAALTPATAAWAATWADGLITVAQDDEPLRRVVDAFRSGGGAGKPVLVQAPVVLAASDDEAQRLAWEGWRIGAIGSPDAKADLALPRHFDEIAASVRPSDMGGAVWLASSSDALADRVEHVLGLGVDCVYLHAVAAARHFLETAGRGLSSRFDR
jgi:coenzyme F420-dependent glucose-6-phosphate dehydrogenase